MDSARPADTTETAAVLRAKKAEIEQQLGVLETKPTDQGSISFGKRVGEGTSMAVDRLSQVAVHDKLQLTLVDVDRAMAKLEDGSYGSCDVCGRPVGAERLEALPWATLCVVDAGRR
jgi:DnaK suppressor protein